MTGHARRDTSSTLFLAIRRGSSVSCRPRRDLGRSPIRGRSPSRPSGRCASSRTRLGRPRRCSRSSISLAFMAFEMAASRFVTQAPGVEHLRLDERHRRAARRAEPRATSSAARSPTASRTRRQASWLFVIASVFVLSVFADGERRRGGWSRTRSPICSKGAEADPRSSATRRTSRCRLLIARRGRMKGMRVVVAGADRSVTMVFFLPSDGAGDGQPRRGQARGRAASAPSKRTGHGDRPGLCLGDGRIDPRDVPHRLLPHRRDRDEGR